jgi:hypothetical protein
MTEAVKIKRSERKKIYFLFWLQLEILESEAIIFRRVSFWTAVSFSPLSLLEKKVDKQRFKKSLPKNISPYFSCFKS